MGRKVKIRYIFSLDSKHRSSTEERLKAEQVKFITFIMEVLITQAAVWALALCNAVCCLTVMSGCYCCFLEQVVWYLSIVHLLFGSPYSSVGYLFLLTVFSFYTVLVGNVWICMRHLQPGAMRRNPLLIRQLLSDGQQMICIRFPTE